jgi:hypothetical protein
LADNRQRDKDKHDGDGSQGGWLALTLPSQGEQAIIWIKDVRG